jgi:hypothetical protein
VLFAVFCYLKTLFELRVLVLWHRMRVRKDLEGGGRSARPC